MKTIIIAFIFATILGPVAFAEAPTAVRVASTILNEKGFRPDVIERQLAHCERNEVRGAYNRAEYLSDRSKMMAWWSEHIQSLEAGAKVILMGKIA